MSHGYDGDWVALAADEAIAEAEQRGSSVVCASGISPSGPIHLGNLREVMTPHLVAEEIRRRGVPCVHILSWDDYDRLRKVPAGVPAEYTEHIGRPLSMVPDPWGEHESWAERYRAPFRAALERLGIPLREISQTEMYASGAYREQVLLAMRSRKAIDAVLNQYRTLQGANDDEDDLATDYYPYRIYCEFCYRDTTTIRFFADDGRTDYVCDCGHQGTVDLSTVNAGKLVWKVDWPMRWAYEDVTFEAGGVDHSSPGSSFTVGTQLVRQIFDGRAPVYLPYSFVGVRGMAKMSGSAGRAPVPADALAILEAPVLRWLYSRRRPNQAITVDFGEEVGRIYDEWDALSRKISAGTAAGADRASALRAASTSVGPLPRPRRVVPFRTLASVVDITADHEEQTLRVLREAQDDPTLELDDLEPRLACARGWIREHVPVESRTQVRSEPDSALLSSLSAGERHAVELLRAGLRENWTLPGLTSLVYAVPKLQAGLSADAPPTAELKKAQREFFVLLYRILIGKDTGPRLPTLLLAIGHDRLESLLDLAGLSTAASSTEEPE